MTTHIHWACDAIILYLVPDPCKQLCRCKMQNLTAQQLLAKTQGAETLVNDYTCCVPHWVRGAWRVSRAQKTQSVNGCMRLHNSFQKQPKQGQWCSELVAALGGCQAYPLQSWCTFKQKHCCMVAALPLCHWEKPHTDCEPCSPHKLPPCRNQPVSHPVGRAKAQPRQPSVMSPVGLNDVPSAAVVSEQRCRAEVQDRLPCRLLGRRGLCALRCGETRPRQVTCLRGKTTEGRLHWRYIC